MNLSNEDREEIGFKVKRLLDFGRVSYLKSKSYNVKLVEYVTKEMTLENVALIAETNNLK